MESKGDHIQEPRRRKHIFFTKLYLAGDKRERRRDIILSSTHPSVHVCWCNIVPRSVHAFPSNRVRSGRGEGHLRRLIVLFLSYYREGKHAVVYRSDISTASHHLHHGHAFNPFLPPRPPPSALRPQLPPHPRLSRANIPNVRMSSCRRNRLPWVDYPPLPGGLVCVEICLRSEDRSLRTEKRSNNKVLEACC